MARIEERVGSLASDCKSLETRVQRLEAELGSGLRELRTELSRHNDADRETFEDLRKEYAGLAGGINELKLLITEQESSREHLNELRSVQAEHAKEIAAIKLDAMIEAERRKPWFTSATIVATEILKIVCALAAGALVYYVGLKH